MPPLDGDTQSVLFLVEEDARITRAVASDGVGPVNIEIDRDARVHAAQFRCPAETLFGLEGALEIADDAPPLPVPLARHVYDGAWTATDELPDVRVRLELDVCARYDVNQVVLPDTLNTGPRLAFEMDDGWLVGINRGPNVPTQWLRFFVDGRTTPFEVQTSTTVFAVGGHRDDGGTIWLFTRTGRLARMSPDGAIEVFGARAPTSSTREADVVPPLGSRTGVGFVLVRQSGIEQDLLRYDEDGTWEVLEHFPDLGISRDGGLVHLGSEIAVLDAPQRRIYRYDGAARHTDVPAGVGLSMLSVVPSLGLVIGSEGGELFVEKDGALSSLSGVREVFSFNDAVAVDDGMFAGGQLRYLQYYPSVGFCGEGTTGTKVSVIRPNGDDLLLVTKNGLLRDTEIVLYGLKRTNPRPDCLRAAP